MNQFEIKRITDHDGNDIKTGHYPDRVGRKGRFFTEPKIGRPVMFDYPVPGCSCPGLLRTAKVQSIEPDKTGLKVSTADGIYYFAEVG